MGMPILSSLSLNCIYFSVRIFALSTTGLPSGTNVVQKADRKKRRFHIAGGCLGKFHQYSLNGKCQDSLLSMSVILSYNHLLFVSFVFERQRIRRRCANMGSYKSFRLKSASFRPRPNPFRKNNIRILRHRRKMRRFRRMLYLFSKKPPPFY